MASPASDKRLARALEWILSFIGAMNCTMVPVLVAPNQRDLFPLPGFYFIEIALLGLLVIAAVAAVQATSTRWSLAPWIGAGALAPFVILAGFSFGFFLLPAVIAFLLTGILMDGRLSTNSSRHAGFMLVAAVAQGALMLFVILLSSLASIP